MKEGENYFEQVGRELARKILKPGLWTRAIVDADGDECKARSVYRIACNRNFKTPKPNNRPLPFLEIQEKNELRGNPYEPYSRSNSSRA